nr:hypothetical protein [Streptomyces sp. QHH-9511]
MRDSRSPARRLGLFAGTEPEPAATVAGRGVTYRPACHDHRIPIADSSSIRSGESVAALLR